MKAYDPSKDSIGLGQLNTPLAKELEDVISHMSDATQHISPEDRRKWDNKLDVETGAIVTTTTNGLMSFADKQKLNSIAYNANLYIHPKSGVVAGTYNSVVVDEYGHIVRAGNVTSIGDAESLGGLAASQYARLLSPVFRGTPELSNTPNEEEYNAIANVRFVRQYVDNAAFSTYGFTEDDVSRWNNKWDGTNAPAATEINSGIMTSVDKRNLNNLVSIFADVTAESVSDWNNKMDYETAPLATQTSKGLMSASDKQILDSMSTTGGVTAEERTRWNNKLDIETGAVATETTNGLMSYEDKMALTNLTTRNVLTNEMIARWDAKLDLATGSTATETANGLMYYQDKKFLNQVRGLPAVSITDDDINRWNNKQEAIGLASANSNGLMSSIDYQKLESLAFASNLNDSKIAEINELVSTLSPATEATDGLMSKTDKTNLNQLMNDRNRYVQVTQEQVTSWTNATTSYNQSIKPTSEQIARWDNLASNSVSTDDLAAACAERVPKEDLFTDGYFLYQNDDGTIGIAETSNSMALFNNNNNISSKIAVSTTATPIQISVSDSNRSTTTGIYITNNGAYYLDNAANTLVTNNLKLATLKNISDLSNEISITEQSLIGLINNQKTDLDSKLDRTELINEDVFGYKTGDLEVFSNPITSGIYNQNDNTTSFIGTTIKNSENNSDIQLYAIENQSRFGPRLIFNTEHGLYYTFSDTGNITSDREVAVQADINEVSDSMNTIDLKYVAKLTELFNIINTAITNNDTKYQEQLDDVYGELSQMYTSVNALSQSLGSLLQAKLQHNDTLLSAIDVKHTDSENNIISNISQIKTILNYLTTVVKNNLTTVPDDYDINTSTTNISTATNSYISSDAIQNVSSTDQFNIGLTMTEPEFVINSMSAIAAPVLEATFIPVSDDPTDPIAVIDLDSSYNTNTEEEEDIPTDDDNPEEGE